MLLVHLTLDPPSGVELLPADTGALIRACAAHEDGLEHVAVHASAVPRPVIGVFLRQPNLATAEATAGRLWRRAVACRPELAAWQLVHAEAPLLRPEVLWPEDGTA
ncbi:hypothetical protein ABT119_21530 [Streptomyces sp. NPDC001910]|uniref:hypothetical protein n=1 Tax=Streptomyces sp. NPDC001910 TaxID=3154403 RepID=UPI00331DDB9D